MTENIVKNEGSEEKPKLETSNYRTASALQKSDVEMSLFNFIHSHWRMYSTHDNTVWLYKDGVYRNDGRDAIGKWIQQVLGGTATVHMINEIIAKCCELHRAFKTVDELIEKKDDKKYDICLENGILNLKTGVFKPHTPDEIFVTKFPIKYDPNAKCPKIEKFVEEVTIDQEKQPEKQKGQLLYELIGWCLSPEYYPHRAIAFVGPGNNGKSTFISMLKAFLGQKNCTSLSLQDLEENYFAKGDLFGKMANLYADLDRSAIEHTGIFKQLTGGDLISGDQKFKDRVNFVNRAKLIFSCNLLPHWGGIDDSNAWWGRWIIIPFYRIFNKETGENPHILQELCTPEEFSGLLNLAIKGAQKLLLTYTFTYDDIPIEEKRIRFLSLSDPIPLFVEKGIRQLTGSLMTRKEMFQAFKAFLEVTKSDFVNRSFLSQSKFTRDFIKYILGNEKYDWLNVKASKAIGNNVYTAYRNVYINKDMKDLEGVFDRISYTEENAEILGQDEEEQAINHVDRTDKEIKATEDLKKLWEGKT